MTAPAFVLDIGYFPRKNLETVVINGGETLPRNCFRECNKLINITIPDSVEIIGAGAFGASGLTKIKLPDSLTSLGEGAFSDCENLAEADLGQGLTEIQGYGYACIGCFENCTSLCKIKFNNVTSIGSRAFRNCTALSTTLDFSDSSFRHRREDL